MARQISDSTLHFSTVIVRCSQRANGFHYTPQPRCLRIPDHPTIDLVQTRAEPIGATVDAIRDALSWLGK